MKVRWETRCTFSDFFSLEYAGPEPLGEWELVAVVKLDETPRDERATALALFWKRRIEEGT